jgi:hypothetical protein
MSYNTELQNNNQELRGILDAVNELPEAGSGGADAPVTPEYTEGLAYTYDEYGKCYEVGRGDWEGAEELRIPSTYDDGVNGELPVKGMAYGAFQNMTMIKRVYADSLTYSRGSSFYGCSLDFLSIKGYKMTASFEFSSSGVKEVIFGDITYIDWGTFGGCSPTCRFDFSECTQIPSLGSEDALGELTAGAQIVVPAHLKEEWKQATNWTLYADYIVVKGQENAQEKTIEITENGSYEVIPDEGKLLSKVSANVNVGGGGDEALIGLIDGSSTRFVIPDGVTSIRSYAFASWQNLQEIVIPDSVKEIDQYAFNNSRGLLSLEIPSGVTAIPAYMAKYCQGLKRVSAPSAKDVGANAFEQCIALTEVSFPAVTNVVMNAFMRCSSLARIALPSVKIIQSGVFSSCSNCLEYDFSECTSIPSLQNKSAFNGINANAKIIVPAALYDKWIAATNWTNYASYIVAAV